MKTASWAVALTVREPAALVVANAAWHLATGAAEVHVFLDNPDDPAAAALRALPGVNVTACDKAHWRAAAPRRQRPDSINRRQSLNANLALGRTGADWLVHLDADEFLLQQSPLGAELAVLEGLDCEIAFPVAERAYVRDAVPGSIFDGVFRLSTKGMNRRADGGDYDAAIFGDHLPCLVHGVLGHSAGKCGVPRGGPFRIGIHWAYRGETLHRAERWRSASTRLLHFDGLTRLHWLSKLVRYGDTPPEVMKIADHRAAQIDLFRQVRAEPGGPADLHAELRELTPERLDRLRAFGLLLETRFDPGPVIAPLLPALPDLSPDAFDAALMAQDAGLAALA